LSAAGHDIQLHVQPHREGTVYDGSNWNFDLKPVSAFRAGGRCSQPFAKFRAAFERFNITVDSTVFAGGRNSTASRVVRFHGGAGPGLLALSIGSVPE
jgi:hypothetical protein